MRRPTASVKKIDGKKRALARLFVESAGNGFGSSRVRDSKELGLFVLK